MYIVHIATELAPIAKVGGLGDVLYGLSKETAQNHHKVDIIIPKYDCINYLPLKNLSVAHRELWSFEGPYRYNNTVWSGELENLNVFLVETHHPNYYFSRGMIYGCPDDNDRFTYFSRAALEYLFKAGKHPDVIHIHDWPTALVGPLYKDMYIPLGLRAGGVVLTIHNLEHQGKCALHNLNRAGLRGENYLTPEKLQDPGSPTEVNLLKGGIEYADFITIVSPTYEKEIKTAPGGCGLDETLVKNQNKLKGILNGIDETFWNPEIDPYLVKHYSTHQVNTPERLMKVLEGKAENRKHIRSHFRLSETDAPIVASVTRLVSQKGPHLIKQALFRTLEKGGQFILLGSAFSGPIEMEFRNLQKQFAKNRNVAICLDTDEALAHLIYAAADMFIIPSLFEPCGLTQLISLRYGTPPIVRSTGGLADTVFDIDTATIPIEKRNGYSFDFPDIKGVNWALDRAIECWFKDKKKWHQIIQQGINMDFSWRHSISEYLAIYSKLALRQA